MVRDDLFKRLLAVNPAQQKPRMEQFDKVFFTASNKTAFEQFGGVTSVVATGVALHECSENTFKQWQNIMQDAGINLTLRDIENIQYSIDDIVVDTVDICNQQVEQLKSEASLLETQVAVSKEQETAKEEERENEMQYRVHGDADPRLIKNFEPIDFATESIASGSPLGQVQISALDEMASSRALQGPEQKETLDRSWTFSSNVHVTENFAYTYHQQPKQIDGYKKEATFFLVEQDNTPPGSINFVLLTNEEAGNLAMQLKQFNQEGSKKIWIESVNRTPAGGIKPAVLHKDYQTGVDQIAFFNGDSSVLYRQYSKDSWLNDKPLEKLKYLEEVIQPIHKDKTNMILPLKAKMKDVLGEKIADDKELNAVKKFKAVVKEVKSGSEVKDTKQKMNILSPSLSLVKPPEAKTMEKLPTIPAPVSSHRSFFFSGNAGQAKEEKDQFTQKTTLLSQEQYNALLTELKTLPVEQSYSAFLKILLKHLMPVLPETIQDECATWRKNEKVQDNWFDMVASNVLSSVVQTQVAHFSPGNSSSRTIIEELKFIKEHFCKADIQRKFLDLYSEQLIPRIRDDVMNKPKLF